MLSFPLFSDASSAVAIVNEHISRRASALVGGAESAVAADACAVAISVVVCSSSSIRAGEIAIVVAAARDGWMKVHKGIVAITEAIACGGGGSVPIRTCCAYADAGAP